MDDRLDRALDAIARPAAVRVISAALTLAMTGDRGPLMAIMAELDEAVPEAAKHRLSARLHLAQGVAIGQLIAALKQAEVDPWTLWRAAAARMGEKVP